MYTRRLITMLAAAALMVAPALAGDTVYVDLSGIDTAFPDMTADERQALKDEIIADLEANFLVAGVDITFTTDASVEADRTININDDLGTHERADGTTGHHYGEWEHGSDSVNVHLDNFTDRHGDDYKTDGEWDINKLANGIGRTAAHELAHSYSVGHNESDPPNKMTEGGLVSSETRANTVWIFDDHTSEVLNENLGKEPCDSTTDYDQDFVEPVFYETPFWPFDPDEYPGFDAWMIFEGPSIFDFDFGWLGQDSDGGVNDGSARFDFIYKASAAEASGIPNILTLLGGHHDEIQFVIRGRAGTPHDGDWFLMSEAQVFLNDPIVTPDGDNAFRILTMAWDTDGDQIGDYIVTLDSLDVYDPLGAQYNGFRVGQVSTCTGDLNGDYTVNLADLAALLAGYGMQHGATYNEGDINGDGAVNLIDLATLLANYGNNCCSAPIPPGTDAWSTPCGTSAFNFVENPIPPGFFGPGSEPFTGSVNFGGEPGLPDTFVQRMGELLFSDPLPASAEVPIQIQELNLTSCQPIIVHVAGQPTLWDVQLNLSDFSTGLGGNMIVTKEHCNGGTYNASLFVQPRFTFTSIDNPGDVRVYDTALEGIPPIEIQSVGSVPWSTDESCDAGTPDGFAPGVADGPCGRMSCFQSAGSPTYQQCMVPPFCPVCP